MTFMHGEDGSPSGYQKQETWMTSPKETQDLLQSPQFQQAQTFGRGPSTNVRSSLDRTREQMIATNQLDNRYSVERARTSLDLPGVTNAASLIGTQQHN